MSDRIKEESFIISWLKILFVSSIIFFIQIFLMVLLGDKYQTSEVQMPEQVVQGYWHFSELDSPQTDPSIYFDPSLRPGSSIDIRALSVQDLQPDNPNLPLVSVMNYPSRPGQLLLGQRDPEQVGFPGVSVVTPQKLTLRELSMSSKIIPERSSYPFILEGDLNYSDILFYPPDFEKQRFQRTGSTRILFTVNPQGFVEMASQLNSAEKDKFGSDQWVTSLVKRFMFKADQTTISERTATLIFFWDSENLNDNNQSLQE